MLSAPGADGARPVLLVGPADGPVVTVGADSLVSCPAVTLAWPETMSERARASDASEVVVVSEAPLVALAGWVVESNSLAPGASVAPKRTRPEITLPGDLRRFLEGHFHRVGEPVRWHATLVGQCLYL